MTYHASLCGLLIPDHSLSSGKLTALTTVEASVSRCAPRVSDQLGVNSVDSVDAVEAKVVHIVVRPSFTATCRTSKLIGRHFVGGCVLGGFLHSVINRTISHLRFQGFN